jgi:uncharacterized protein (TIGR03435 family)
VAERFRLAVHPEIKTAPGYALTVGKSGLRMKCAEKERAGGDFSVGGFRLLEGQIAGERDDASQLGIEALQAVEVDVS